MTFLEIIGSVQLGLVFSLVVMGVYLSFRVLHFPDLTVDGSFPLGGAVLAAMVMGGFHPVLGLMLAMLAGFVAGSITAWLHVRWKIMPLLAGILMMTALYSINLRIMGQPNASLFGLSSIFSSFEADGFDMGLVVPLMCGAIAIVMLVLLYFFLKTEIGLSLRATGANPRMARAQGIDDGRYMILGLGISNALVALGGALFVEVQSVADVNAGVGKIVEGLAAVMIGEALFVTRKIHWALLACIAGAILYRLAVAMALHGDALGFRTSDLSLMTALIVAMAMMLPLLRKNIRDRLHLKELKK